MIPLFETSRHRFSAQTIRLYYALLGAALLALIAKEIASGQIGVQLGELCGRRLLPMPSLGMGALYAEWLLLFASAGALLVGFQPKTAVRAACLALAFGALQRWLNQKGLLTILLFFTALKAPDAKDESLSEQDFPNLGLVRYQILLVYAFASLNKITAGFGSGASLTNLFAVIEASGASTWIAPGAIHSWLAARPAAAAGLSWAVIAWEAHLPFFLWKRPRLGLLGVFLLHGAFSATVPGVLSFGLTMLAGAVLFLELPSTSAPRPS